MTAYKDYYSVIQFCPEHLGAIQLIIVGDFRSKRDESKNDVGRILEAHKVKLYAEWELGELIREIATTGKDLTDEPHPAFAERSRRWPSNAEGIEIESAQVVAGHRAKAGDRDTSDDRSAARAVLVGAQ